MRICQLEKLPIRAKRLSLIAREMTSPISYLEIGVATGETMLRVPAGLVVGVDPAPEVDPSLLSERFLLFELESDVFFANYGGQFAFDLVFLDGLHEWRQTLRDLHNVLPLLKQGGLIVIDDSVPTDKYSANPDPSVIESAHKAGLENHRRWYGDVFKAIMALEKIRPDLEYVTVGGVNGVHGQTIVWKKGLREPIQRSDDAYLQSLDLFAFEELDFTTGLPDFYRKIRETRRLYSNLVKRSAREWISSEH